VKRSPPHAAPKERAIPGRLHAAAIEGMNAKRSCSAKNAAKKAPARLFDGRYHV
jgi:hypothetical protein